MVSMLFLCKTFGNSLRYPEDRRYGLKKIQHYDYIGHTGLRIRYKWCCFGRDLQ